MCDYFTIDNERIFINPIKQLLMILGNLTGNEIDSGSNSCPGLFTNSALIPITTILVAGITNHFGSNIL